MAIIKVEDQNFQETIAQEGVVLVDFWAPWCGPCKMISPVLEEMSGKLGDKLTIAKMNVDDNPETPGAFGVMSIPTLKLFKNGVEVSSTVGFKPLADMMSWVEPHLN
ncbi:thioredoxin [Paenibacillus rigui]|uniref:Thioredoxin n=1 Tax=Paenibacillus rigui TaxID=554312 RepID=A0A229UIW1_9BACL|nr:thioredoxin [Paenibacillus rigui]OXM83304.1 thioredoxin [Paenibacillus rigui]